MKMIVKDIKGKVHEESFQERSFNVLHANISCKPQVFKNKKAYSRKEKHKVNYALCY